MATISFFELEPFEEKFFKKSLKGHNLRFSRKPLTARNVKKYSDSDVVVVFVFSKITAKVIDSLPNLSLIATMSTGYDHIDVSYANKKKIIVSNVPFYGQNTVAEHAFGLLQSLNRNIVEAVRRTRDSMFDYSGLMGRDLEGKTLGVLGTGHIGQYMIRYARAFGMKVIASDAFPNKELAKSLGFSYVSLNTLCKQSDFISLHLPLLPTTKHILGKKEFSLMKKKPIIVNTGRGPLINTEDLIDALDKKLIRGAALDVLEQECALKNEVRPKASFCTADADALKLLVENHNLLHRNNVIITPHLAFYTEEALMRIMKTTLQNVKGSFSKRYKNKVVYK
jgi:D-lactate dehydrogenase